MKLNQVNIGAEIEARINQLGLSKSEFGRKIGIPQQNVNRILEKPSIDTDKLAQICAVLDYNFFALYATDATQSMTVQNLQNSAASFSGDALVLNDGCPEQEKHLIEKLNMENELLKKLLDRTEKQLEEKERFITHLLETKK